VAFPRKLLNHDEEVVLDLRPHWHVLFGPAALLAITVVALVVAAASEVDEWLQVALGAATLVALAWFAGRYARWGSTNFVVTSDRLIHRSGVFAKKGIEIPLERVNTVFFDQSLFERLLGSGDLVIESGGERGQQRFSDVSRPSHVQNEIHRQIEQNQRRSYGGRPVEESVVDRLAKLDELRRRGVVTQAEFDAKKASLLDRL
jgi:uncharacterized membrane protein YdbT with pleckstrin-like domain